MSSSESPAAVATLGKKGVVVGAPRLVGIAGRDPEFVEGCVVALNRAEGRVVRLTLEACTSPTTYAWRVEDAFRNTAPEDTVVVFVDCKDKAKTVQDRGGLVARAEPSGRFGELRNDYADVTVDFGDFLAGARALRAVAERVATRVEPSRRLYG